MSIVIIVVAAVAAAALVGLLIAVAIAFGPAQRARALQKRIEAREAREYEVHEKLREHTKEFEKEVNTILQMIHQRPLIKHPIAPQEIYFMCRFA